MRKQYLLSYYDNDKINVGIFNADYEFKLILDLLKQNNIDYKLVEYIPFTKWVFKMILLYLLLLLISWVYLPLIIILYFL